MTTFAEFRPLPWQAEALESIIYRRRSAFGWRGGVGSGKSLLTCVALASLCYTYPDSDWLLGMDTHRRLEMVHLPLLRKLKLRADYSSFAVFLAGIATDELAGRPISAADNERLLRVGGTLEDLWWRTSDVPQGGMPAMDAMGAIIADIASGRDHTTGDITAVEIGTGWVDQILVLVPDDAGRFHVALGGVYSYYEFRQPVSDRLTDEAWRAMLKAGEAPARPTWVAPIVR